MNKKKYIKKIFFLAVLSCSSVSSMTSDKEWCEKVKALEEEINQWRKQAEELDRKYNEEIVPAREDAIKEMQDYIQELQFSVSYGVFSPWYKKINELKLQANPNQNNIQELKQRTANLRNEIFTNNLLLPFVRMVIIDFFVTGVGNGLICTDLIHACFGTTADDYETLPFISELDEDKELFAHWLFNLMKGKIKSPNEEISLGRSYSSLSVDMIEEIYLSFMKSLYTYAQTTESFKALNDVYEESIVSLCLR
jgi:hypothetical protein